jgi:hypothetical protein
VLANQAFCFLFASLDSKASDPTFCVIQAAENQNCGYLQLFFPQNLFLENTLPKED